MYDSLVGFDLQKGGVGPGVAESWELAEDGLTWTFHLRPGQKFHNGDPLTAQDVKFSLQRQMAPNSLAAAAATMRRTIKSIDVVDDLTVQINTNTPQIGLPPSLSRAVAPEGAVMPKDYIEKVGEEEFRRKPIGSGPWRFVRSVPGDRIEFEAVDYPHWRGTPHFKNLQILLVPEESTRIAMVRTGEAAIASIGPDTMLSASRGGLEVLSVPAHDAGAVPVLGRLSARVQGQPDRQSACAPGAVAGDRPPGDHRSGDERPGEHARIRSRPSATPSTSAPIAGRSGPRTPIAMILCSAKKMLAEEGYPERVRSELRQHRAAWHAVHGRCRHRCRRHVDQDRRPA